MCLNFKLFITVKDRLLRSPLTILKTFPSSYPTVLGFLKQLQTSYVVSIFVTLIKNTVNACCQVISNRKASS